MTESTPHAALPTPRTASFRADVHGLRGLAVLLVVLYHVFIGRVSGGVDVFLFISAYFLTGTFVRRLEVRRAVAPVNYWGRTFKRLLPPTLVVTILTVIAALIVLPASEHRHTLDDAFYTLIQAENWWLISQATDYYTADRTVASPFQHFWSLSIQGQVFLLWPLMFALIALAVRLRERRYPPVDEYAHRVRVWRVSAIGIGALTLASFVWSVYSTQTQQTIAYFDTFARLWEFGLGALVAIALPLIASRTPVLDPASTEKRRARFAISMVGVASLVSMGVLVDVQGHFPGWLALWPLTSAALVMVMGYNPVLASRPLQFLGGISYGLYLAHWPILIITLHALQMPQAGLWLGVLITGASLGAAWLLTKFVDTPFRRWTWAGASTRRSIGVAGATLAVGLAFVLAIQGVFSHQQAERERLAVSNNPGARVLFEQYTEHPDADPLAPELPGAADLWADWWELDGACRGDARATGVLRSTCMMREGNFGAPTVLYLGNSRMQQLAGAIDPGAEAAGWRSIALLEGGCTPGESTSLKCRNFTRAAMEYIQELRPDVVVMETTFVPTNGRERTSMGLEDLVWDLHLADIPVIAVRDQPRMGFNPNPCRDYWGDGNEACLDEVDRNMRVERPDSELLAIDGVYGVDLTHLICPGGVCQPSIGNVTVFLDGNHITATYADSMAEEASWQLESQGWRW